MDMTMTGRSACGMRRGRGPSAAHRAHGSQKTARTPWFVKRWGRGQITGDSIWPRADGLALDEPPEDPRPPGGCGDERPGPLLGEVLAPLPRHPGNPTRDDDAAERPGPGWVVRAGAPVRRGRVRPVRPQRTAVDEALVMKALVGRHEPTSASSRLGHETFNTQTSGSCSDA